MFSMVWRCYLTCNIVLRRNKPKRSDITTKANKIRASEYNSRVTVFALAVFHTQML